MENMLKTLYAVLFFILGSLAGSFLNILICRLAQKKPPKNNRFRCPRCGHRIAGADIIPIIGWFISGGECRSCQKKIPIKYMLTELLTAASYLTAFLVLDFSAELIYACLLFPALVVLSLWDIEKKEIPYACSIFIAVLGIISIFTSKVPWYEHLIGAVIVAVPFGIMCYFGAMGGGDVQLTAAAGLLLGWNIVPSVMIGIILGAIFGIIVKVLTKSSVIVFGPFLSLGIMAGYLWGENIINAYLGLIR